MPINGVSKEKCETPFLYMHHLWSWDIKINLTKYIQNDILIAIDKILLNGGNQLLITRETDYALRILRILANGKRVTSSEICKRELLPQQFVYKILKKLEKAGIIQITRGVDGGCRLTGDLKKLSLYDLTEIVEGNKFISACMQPNFQCAWRKKYNSKCNVHCHLLKIQEVFDRELRTHSIYQILFEQV